MKADIKILANPCLILPFAVRIRQLVRAPGITGRAAAGSRGRNRRLFAEASREGLQNAHRDCH
jgi:hypothetical protein